LSAKKAENLRVLNLAGVSPMADYFVIATANSTPHLHALAEDTVIRLKKLGHRVSRREGDATSGWVVLDYFHVVVHLLLEPARAYYNLETLWNDATEVPLDADGRLVGPAPVEKSAAPRRRAPKAAAAPADAAAPKAKAPARPRRKAAAT
jgi:ribosome-associated protein